MGNIADYIDWRGDITFDIDPFNEVDNLVLSEVSYADLEDVLKEENVHARIPLKEINRRYWNIHTKEEVMARQDTVKMAPFLMKKAAESDRFGEVTVSNLDSFVDESTQSQFCAITLWLPDGTAYVAYRGTDDTLVGWKEDFNMSFLYQTPGQIEAANYVNRIFLKDTTTRLRIGGHSKGGNFAIYAGAFCDPSIQKRIIRIYSNDGPGFRTAVVDSEPFQRMLPKVTKLVPEDSVVGMLLDSDMDHSVIKSSNSGVLAHDALSWQVKRNRFITVERRSGQSHYTDATLSAWIAGIPPKERKEFVDILFDSMESTGKTNLSQVNRNPFRTMQEMKRYIETLPQDQQDHYYGVWKELAKSGANTLWSGFKEKTKEEIKKRLPTELVQPQKDTTRDDPDAIDVTNSKPSSDNRDQLKF